MKWIEGRFGRKHDRAMIPNLVIQAGGKGTRLSPLTNNMPKALVPVWGKPLIFHALDKFPNSRVVIIGDERFDVLERYLAAFCLHPFYEVVKASGKGTCAGLAQAANLLDGSLPVFLTWGDLLYLRDPLPLFHDSDQPAIGVSGDFPCRWYFHNGVLKNYRSTEYGVAGCFWFPRTSFLRQVPESGEFVRYLSAMPKLNAVGIRVGSVCKEVNTLDDYIRIQASPFACRPFNRIERLADGTLEKVPVDEQGRQLAELEENWYSAGRQRHLDCIPKIYSVKPLRMEYINGVEPFLINDQRQQQHYLSLICQAIRTLHEASPPVVADLESLESAYIRKTRDRLAKVLSLIPFVERKKIKINGRACPNPLFRWDELAKTVRAYYPSKFRFIHGDPTFSNILLAKERVVFIDPRGYFGNTALYGDPAYDWAKLLYSVQTNYDQFNRRKFDLRISSEEVTLKIASSGWEHLADQLVRESNCDPLYLRLILGIIWLSLTTYAWDDYDKICGAFYKGAEVLRDTWG